MSYGKEMIPPQTSQTSLSLTGTGSKRFEPARRHVSTAHAPRICRVVPPRLRTYLCQGALCNNLHVFCTHTHPEPCEVCKTFVSTSKTCLATCKAIPPKLHVPTVQQYCTSANRYRTGKHKAILFGFWRTTVAQQACYADEEWKRSKLTDRPMSIAPSIALREGCT